MRVFLFIFKNLGEYKRLFLVVSVASVINGAASFIYPLL